MANGQSYRNITRRGVRTTTNINPRVVQEDIDADIRLLSPDATPIQSLTRFLGAGPKPKAHKIQVMQEYEFDHIDQAIDVKKGSDTSKDELSRFLRFAVTQPSRPDVSNQVYYTPQDKFFIVETGQVVEVYMTPNDSIKHDGVNKWTVRADFAQDGSASDKASTTPQGYIIVRNIENAPIQPFTNSTIIYMGRTIHEGQNIEAESSHSEVLFDYNYVEHKETVIKMTEDQKNMVQVLMKKPDWTRMQEQDLKRFKRSIEYSMMFGERAYGGDVDGLPKHHMRGLYHTIQTNVAYYNPHSVVDFERMFSDFLFHQAFRYNPNGLTKIGICGPTFLYNFNMAFRDYRRTSELNIKAKSIGIDIQAYELPGGFKLNLMRSDILRQETKLEDWCFVIDPNEAELRLVKDYTSKEFSLANERIFKLMVEWQGTIAWHLEQTHALLRTA